MARLWAETHAQTARLRAQANQAIAQFIAAEIETAMVFCEIAKRRPEGERRTRNLVNAGTAFETAQTLDMEGRDGARRLQQTGIGFGEASV